MIIDQIRWHWNYELSRKWVLIYPYYMFSIIYRNIEEIKIKILWKAFKIFKNNLVMTIWQEVKYKIIMTVNTASSGYRATG